MALTIIERNVQLDLYDHDLTPSKIKAIALDSKTRYVGAEIHNGGQTYDVGQNTGVTLTIIRPDKTGVQITGETFQYTVGEGETVYGAYAELTQTALAVSGTLLAQFMLTSGEQILRTEIFTINNGVALDATVSEWAGEYQGYNLDELVQTVNESSAKVDEIERDVSELKEGFNDLYNTAYVTDSASGSVAHFVDGADNVPLKSLKVNIEPVQSGSGDPSPSNVRPISGGNSTKVTRAGKNLLVYPYSTVDSVTRNGITFEVHKTADGRVDYVSASGTATDWAYFNFNTWDEKRTNAKLLVGKTVKLTGCPKFGNDSKVAIMFQYRRPGSKQNIDLADDHGEGSKEFTIPSDIDSWAIYIQIAQGIQVDDARFYPMLRLVSDTDDTYESYNGKDYSISLSSAGTVYGGTLDAVSGKLTVDRMMKTINGNEPVWGTTDNYNTIYAVSYMDLSTAGIQHSLDVITNMGFVVCRYNYAAMDAEEYAICIRNEESDRWKIYLRTPNTSLDALKSWLASNNLQVVYALATPLTYQLSATEIKSLLGVNNVWSDAGDVEVEYRADTKLYIDKRLAEVTA